ELGEPRLELAGVVARDARELVVVVRARHAVGVDERAPRGGELMVLLAALGEVEQRGHRGIELLAAVERSARLGYLAGLDQLPALIEQALCLHARGLRERARRSRQGCNRSDHHTSEHVHRSLGISSSSFLGGGGFGGFTGGAGGCAAGGATTPRAPRTMSVTSRPSCHEAISSAVPIAPSRPPETPPMIWAPGWSVHLMWSAWPPRSRPPPRGPRTPPSADALGHAAPACRCDHDTNLVSTTFMCLVSSALGSGAAGGGGGSGFAGSGGVGGLVDGVVGEIADGFAGAVAIPGAGGGSGGVTGGGTAGGPGRGVTRARAPAPGLSPGPPHAGVPRPLAA